MHRSLSLQGLDGRVEQVRSPLTQKNSKHNSVDLPLSRPASVYQVTDVLLKRQGRYVSGMVSVTTHIPRRSGITSSGTCTKISGMTAGIEAPVSCLSMYMFADGRNIDLSSRLPCGGQVNES
jgi:hypothetical protein